MKPEPAWNLELKPIERIHFRSALVAIGDFICTPEHALFRESGPASKHNFSFPRTCTEIARARAPRSVEGPDVVTLFHRGEAFSQRRVTPSGTRTDWFVVEDTTLLDAVARYDPGVRDRPDAPFARPSVPCPGALYVAQRRLTSAARRGRVSPTDVEEGVLRLLDEVLGLVGIAPRPRPASRPTGVRPDPVEGAKAILAETYQQPLRLTAIAQELGESLARLCRVFRARTGLTLSDYRRILRLRGALETLLEGDGDLASVALELGFASHSHFTFAFRRSFGCAPSVFRERERRLVESFLDPGRRRARGGRRRQRIARLG